MIMPEQPIPVDDDWEDPWAHTFLTMCTGCTMCATWEGRTYDDIRAEHEARQS